MDLDEAQSVKDEDAKDLASEINGIFMKTSSKTGKGIEQLFQEICKKILESYKDLKEENPNDSKDSKGFMINPLGSPSEIVFTPKLKK